MESWMRFRCNNEADDTAIVLRNPDAFGIQVNYLKLRIGDHFSNDAATMTKDGIPNNDASISHFCVPDDEHILYVHSFFLSLSLRLSRIVLDREPNPGPTVDSRDQCENIDLNRLHMPTLTAIELDQNNNAPIATLAYNSNFGSVMLVTEANSCMYMRAAYSQ